MNTMEERLLEITLISARDLKNVTLISKMNVYAVVSIVSSFSYPYYYTTTIKQHKTHVVKHCGPNPTWHLPIGFSLPEYSLQSNRLSLHFNLLSHRTLGGDKLLGEVNVRVKELFDRQNRSSSSGVGGQESVVTYSVRTRRGKARGSLSFSFKFGDVVPVAGEPVMAYPAAAGSSVPYQYQYQYPEGYYSQGNGYNGPGAQQRPKRNNNNNGKMALGIGAGLLGGLLIGDMISDVGNMAAFDPGFDPGFGGF